MYIEYIEKLTRGNKTIPGLNLEDVMDLFIKTKIPDLNKLSKEDLKKYIKDMKESLKEKFFYIIAEMNNLYHQILESIKNAAAAVKRAIKNMVIPAVVSVPPAVNNPGFLMNDIPSKIEMILNTLNIAAGMFIVLFRNATKINFQLPQVVLQVVDTLAVTRTAVMKLSEHIPS